MDSYELYHDIVVNKTVDGFDKIQFLAFLGKDIVYAPLALD